ncbi:hypothetical protein V1290_005352 [Bradyrhizobium sp. AZCC 1578]|uniref:hypothetical protein n=1 Tax=Bradyrhizobium sp. AZCC 1578 TaxID=3117027 RepID=UPI002FF0C665
MSVRRHLMQSGTLAAMLLCATVSAAQAGHEVPYYPSFYPQEIRIEPLDPGAAAREFSNAKDPLHAYLGTIPQFSGEMPSHLKSVVSLRSFITVKVNPERAQGREARCRAIENAANALVSHPDVVPHRYPITPYHADYIGHVDRGADTKPTVGSAADPSASLAVRAQNAGSEDMVLHRLALDPTDWDIRFDEVAVNEVLRAANVGFNAWPAPPWVKEGWFQAYHLLQPAVSGAAERKHADELYGRLVEADYRDPAERLNIARDLITELTRGCDRAVVGYRLRREFYSDDFSNGIENIAVDSQFGFNSAIVLRTLKLKDLPWNGWLRLGIEIRATAAWNPVAGFTDAPGRLVWAIVGDDAFLAVPYNSLWAPNRAEVRPAEQSTRQSIRVPADALVPEPGTGRLVPTGAAGSAMTKVVYRVLAASFQDGSEMGTADLIYPYAFAYRWGSSPAAATFDAEVSAATSLIRDRLKGVRVIRVEESKLPIADLVFTYRSPIVEVYVDAIPTDEHEDALVAPPWSSVPWHVLALMEAAVEREIAAFSQSEAKRRNLPWLDLARDPAQRDKLRALIKEFATAGYRPAALESLVNAQAATARWQALDQFVESNNHLLVTNGPYRLRSFSPDVYTFDVIREFIYPVGLGTFDFYAYPAKAFVTRVEHIGNRILVTADAEIALKQQRDRRIVRVSLKHDTLREMLPIRPVARYVLLGETGRVVAAGDASREGDGRFAVSLPPNLPTGNYTVFTAIFLDGNTINPTIGRMDFRSN